MPTLNLAVRDIAVLNAIADKIDHSKEITDDERQQLCIFLYGLPVTETLLQEKFPLEDEFEVNVFSIGEMKPHLEKWIQLFERLPNNGSSIYPSAGWVDGDNNPDFWRENRIIFASFIPSYKYSQLRDGLGLPLTLYLITDGTASVEIYTMEEAEMFPHLYKFKGSWKEAYLLVVKTLKEGWPQTKFPRELEQLLIE